VAESDCQSASFEYLDHAADLGIRVRAPTPEQLFQTAGHALMNWIGPAPRSGAEQECEITLSSGDLEELLVRWLQELLYLFQERHRYFAGTDQMEVTTTGLRAAVRLRHWDETAGEFYHEVKAVTYHKLRIAREEEGWVATVIVDI
jgi:SHS2 domain-containing protein